MKNVIFLLYLIITKTLSTLRKAIIYKKNRPEFNKNKLVEVSENQEVKLSICVRNALLLKTLSEKACKSILSCRSDVSPPFLLFDLKS